MHSSTLLDHRLCAQSPKRQEKDVQFLQVAQTFQILDAAALLAAAHTD